MVVVDDDGNGNGDSDGNGAGATGLGEGNVSGMTLGFEAFQNGSLWNGSSPYHGSVAIIAEICSRMQISKNMIFCFETPPRLNASYQQYAVNEII